MLTTHQLEKYADVLLWGMQTARKPGFQSQDIVLLRYDFPARALAEVLFEKLISRGLYPVHRIGGSPTMERALFSKGNSGQITFIPPGEEELMHHLNGCISLLAPESLTHLQDIDPERIGTSVLSRKKLRDILDQRENQGLFGWTLGLLATPELAKNADIEEHSYWDQIVRACYLDHPDPVGKWQEIFDQASEIKKALNSLHINQLHIQSANCDLIVTPGQMRQWVGVSGHNIPSFELFTSPDWRGTEGVYYMNQPTYRSGNLVTNLRLEFKEGCVCSAAAEQGQDFVRKQLHLDQNADKIGEFSLTDKRFSRIDTFMAHTLFDENYGGDFGNCHIALGASYAETYSPGAGQLTESLKASLGFNDSALHWDLVNIEPKVVTAKLSTGQRKTLYEDGVFTL
ncbi:MAG: aminopeptidase [Desulfovermiculus sp.]|nr:aminopeptidase [Desulfovermiculus sp.]